MGQTQSWITIDECVYSYINEAQLSNHQFYRLWHIAFDIMTDLGLDFFYQVKSVKVPVNPNLTVELPSDFLQWVKVGVFNNKGEVMPLAYNEKLTTYAQFSPDRISKTQDNSLYNFYQYDSLVWYNFWNGQTFTNLYGVPSGAPFIGSFKIDRNTGVILLNEEFAYEYVVLEYLASPKEGEIYYAPVQFKEAIKTGLAWKDIRSIPSSRRGNLGDKRDRRAEFYNERRLGWARYRPFNLMDAYEWSQRNTRRTVKI